MSNLEQTRQKAIQELDTVAEKQRFGYFSIPATLAIGDGQFAGKTIKKDEFGRVATQPRNVSVKPTATGNTKSSYFSLDKSIYEGDPYMDPGKLDRLENLKLSKLQPEGKEVYKPATSVTKSL
jgi:hypothetical protein